VLKDMGKIPLPLDCVCAGSCTKRKKLNGGGRSVERARNTLTAGVLKKETTTPAHWNSGSDLKQGAELGREMETISKRYLSSGRNQKKRRRMGGESVQFIPEEIPFAAEGAKVIQGWRASETPNEGSPQIKNIYSKGGKRVAGNTA